MRWITWILFSNGPRVAVSDQSPEIREWMTALCRGASGGPASDVTMCTWLKPMNKTQTGLRLQIDQMETCLMFISVIRINPRVVFNCAMSYVIVVSGCSWLSQNPWLFSGHVVLQTAAGWECLKRPQCLWWMSWRKMKSWRKKRLPCWEEATPIIAHIPRLLCTRAAFHTAPVERNTWLYVSVQLHFWQGTKKSKCYSCIEFN